MAKETTQEEILTLAQTVDYQLTRVYALVRAVDRGLSALLSVHLAGIGDAVAVHDMPIVEILSDEVEDAQECVRDLLRMLGEPKTEPTTEEKTD